MTALRALPYLGGKATGGSSGTGRWIASLLPQEREVCYVEPFAGMLGVLLQRPRSLIEMANDADERIVNWWRVLRWRTDELLTAVMRTPISRSDFELALQTVNDHDPMRSAWAVSVLLMQGITVSLNAERSHWRRRFIPNRENGTRGLCANDNFIARLESVAQRIRYVQLECTDAIKLLRSVADRDDTVVYADPPYASAPAHKHYGRTLDTDAFTEALLACRGRVAVSGYGEEWDHLGFVRHEHAATSYALGSLTADSRPTRTEVLWTNFEPLAQGTLL